MKPVVKIGLLLVTGVCALALPLYAQESTSEPSTPEATADGMTNAMMESVAQGLNNPRGLFIDENGTLYIAEAGRGGDIPGQGQFGPAMFGGTAQIVTIGADGTQSALLTSLPSRDENGETIGAQAVAVDGDRLWVALGQGDLRTPFTFSVVGLDRETLRVQVVIDVYAAEASQNPDGDVIDSNPVDVEVGPDGYLYIVDAGANTVWRWSEENTGGLLEPFAVWMDNAVPTSIDFDLFGDAYIGFLTGFPFPEGGSRVERWSADGELIESYPGLTTVVNVAVGSDGSVYAVEFARFGDRGWTPNTGRVVLVTAEGIYPVAEGLNLPYGLQESPAGGWLVTVNSAYVGAGAGMVVRVGGDGTTMTEMGSMMDNMMETAEATSGTLEPLATPEAGS